ncbi:MAG: hypothetical protein KBT19_04995 [Lachnospiraceae bacterium]|nr:hypothetical protein [Candidatus Colinaster equi]
METNNIQNKKTSIFLNIIAMIFNLMAIGGVIFNFFATDERPLIVTNVITMILCLAVMFYWVYNYRTPHGNVIRYVILLFAFVLASDVFVNQGISKVCLALTLASCVLVAYAAGRLGKPKVIIILFSIVAAFLIAIIVAERLTPPPQGINNDPAVLGLPEAMANSPVPAGPPEGKGGKIAMFSFNLSRLLLWLAVGTSYFVRYKSHKDAGEKREN